MVVHGIASAIVDNNRFYCNIVPNFSAKVQPAQFAITDYK
jgi:hypothetical protein